MARVTQYAERYERILYSSKIFNWAKGMSIVIKPSEL